MFDIIMNHAAKQGLEIRNSYDYGTEYRRLMGIGNIENICLIICKYINIINSWTYLKQTLKKFTAYAQCFVD